MNVPPQLEDQLAKFVVTKSSYDKVMNDLYFHDILKGAIIRYDMDENKFSEVPIKISETYNLYYADSGYVYILKYAYENPRVLLESFHYTTPEELKTHPEINSGKPRFFVYSDDNQKRYVSQNSVTYLIHANTLQKMPADFAINTNPTSSGDRNFKKGIVAIYNNNGNQIDTITLKYEAISDIQMQNKLIVTYNSYRSTQLAAPAQASVSSTYSPKKTSTVESETKKDPTENYVKGVIVYKGISDYDLVVEVEAEARYIVKKAPGILSFNYIDVADAKGIRFRYPKNSSTWYSFGSSDYIYSCSTGKCVSIRGMAFMLSSPYIR